MRPIKRSPSMTSWRSTAAAISSARLRQCLPLRLSSRLVQTDNRLTSLGVLFRENFCDDPEMARGDTNVGSRPNTVQISSGMSFWIGLLVRADGLEGRIGLREFRAAFSARGVRRSFRVASRLAEGLGVLNAVGVGRALGGVRLGEFGWLPRCRSSAAAGRLCGAPGSCSSCV